jgi:hypothetical protein
MGNKLQAVTVAKGDAFSIIKKYLADPDAVQLTADAENMLKRLMYCDALFRQNQKTTEEIKRDLQETFIISEFTAMRDISNTQKLFATARAINKTYLAHIHLERINRDIENFRDRIFFYEDDDMPGVKRPTVPDAKEVAALAKLEQVYSQTLDMIQDEKPGAATPPPIFNFTQVVMNTGMTVQDAMAQADAMLNGSSTPQLQDPDDGQLDEWEEIGQDPEND